MTLFPGFDALEIKIDFNSNQIGIYLLLAYEEGLSTIHNLNANVMLVA